eukprot:6195016-Pleurochrysis_carterae.AAC.1
MVKGHVSNWLLAAAEAIIANVSSELSEADFGPLTAQVAESISSSICNNLDIFKDLMTKHHESKYLQKQIPMVSSIRRVMPSSAVAKTRSRSEPSVQQPENQKSLVV